MKSVRIYYAGIPAKNKKIEKRLVLENFHKGVFDGGSTEVEGFDYRPSDLAVMQGWVHANSGTTPHLMFRRRIIEGQRAAGKHTLAIDSNLFLYKDPENVNTYLRFSLNDVFPTTGTYFTDNVDPTRWQQVSREIGVQLQPWRQKGGHILLCLQRNGGWSMGGLDVMDWCRRTISEIRKYSDRHIVVRAHPGDKKAASYLILNLPNVSISKSPSIEDDLFECWATVTYNSSPGVASAIEGIPVFVTDPNPKVSQAYDVANYSLKDLENPNMPDRQAWIEKLAMCHFSFKDLKEGKAWHIIKDYL